MGDGVDGVDGLTPIRIIQYTIAVICPFLAPLLGGSLGSIFPSTSYMKVDSFGFRSVSFGA